jgi:hypothetical protein
MFLFAVAGLFAVTADFACLEDVCADYRVGEYRNMQQIQNDRVLLLNEALSRSGVTLSRSQTEALERDGQLFGIVKLDRPVKHPNGAVEMPAGWLPPIPEGHPWTKQLTPSDDAYYSFVEERIFKAKLFDPANPEHMKAARAYVAKANSTSPEFVAWTYAEKTECRKKVKDAPGTGVGDGGADAE